MLGRDAPLSISSRLAALVGLDALYAKNLMETAPLCSHSFHFYSRASSFFPQAFLLT